MAAKTKYLVLSSKENPAAGWEADLQGSLGICHTLTKAYEIALFLSGITAPKISYRKCLSVIKVKGAVRLESEKEWEPSALIVLARIY
jgi:hypothetical protein